MRYYPLFLFVFVSSFFILGCHSLVIRYDTTGEVVIYSHGQANFGPQSYDNITSFLVHIKTPDSTLCVIDNNVKGYVPTNAILITRTGTCSAVIKAKNAQALGAKALIIADAMASSKVIA